MTARRLAGGIVTVEKFAVSKQPPKAPYMRNLFEKSLSAFQSVLGTMPSSTAQVLLKGLNDLSSKDTSYVVSFIDSPLEPLVKADLISVPYSPFTIDLFQADLNRDPLFESVNKGIQFSKLLGGAQAKEGHIITDPRTGYSYQLKNSRWVRVDKDQQQRAEKQKLGESATSKRLGRKWFANQTGHVMLASTPVNDFKYEVAPDSPAVHDYLTELLPLEVWVGHDPEVDQVIADSGFLDESELNTLDTVRDILQSYLAQQYPDSDFEEAHDNLLDWLVSGAELGEDQSPVDLLFDILEQSITETAEETGNTEFLEQDIDALHKGWFALCEKYAQALQPTEKRPDETEAEYKKRIKQESILEQVKDKLAQRHDAAALTQYVTEVSQKLKQSAFADVLLGEESTEDERALALILGSLGDWKPTYGGQGRMFTHMKLTSGKSGAGALMTDSFMLENFDEYDPDSPQNASEYFADDLEMLLLQATTRMDLSAQTAEELGTGYASIFNQGTQLGEAILSAYEERYGELSSQDREDKGKEIEARLAQTVARMKQMRIDYNKGKGWYGLDKFIHSQGGGGTETPIDALKDTQAIKSIIQGDDIRTETRQTALKAKNNKELFEVSDTLGIETTDPETGERKVIKDFQYDYQKRYLNWMAAAKRGIVAADTGLGKTPIGISFVDHLIHTGKAKRGIFVLPPALMSQWPQEIETFRKGSSVLVLDSSMTKEERTLALQRVNAGEQDADFVIMSTGLLRDADAKGGEDQYLPDGRVIPASKSDVADVDQSAFLTELKNLEGAMFVDEFHLGGYKTGPSAKSEGSFNHQVIQQVAGAEREYFFGMTATPIPNEPGDLYDLLNLANPGCLGPDKGRFMNNLSETTYNFETKQWEVANWSKLRDLKELFDPYMFVMRKTDEDYLAEMKEKGALPELVNNEKYATPIKPTDEQQALFHLLHTDLEAASWDRIKQIFGVPEDVEIASAPMIDEETGEPVYEIDEETGEEVPVMKPLMSPADIFEKGFEQEWGLARIKMVAKGVAMTIARKASLHPATLFADPTHPALTNIASPKIDACVDTIIEHFNNPANYHEGHGVYKPCVIFADFRSSFDLLKHKLKEAGFSDEQMGMIATGVNQKERSRIQDEVNQGKMPIVMVGIRAGGAGLNLQRSANHMIFLDKPWSPAQWEQCFGRVRRTGFQKQGGALKQAIQGFHDPKDTVTVTRFDLSGMDFQDSSSVATEVALKTQGGFEGGSAQLRDRYQAILEDTNPNSETASKRAGIVKQVSEWASSRIRSELASGGQSNDENKAIFAEAAGLNAAQVLHVVPHEDKMYALVEQGEGKDTEYQVVVASKTGLNTVAQHGDYKGIIEDYLKADGMPLSDSYGKAGEGSAMYEHAASYLDSLLPAPKEEDYAEKLFATASRMAKQTKWRQSVSKALSAGTADPSKGVYMSAEGFLTVSPTPNLDDPSAAKTKHTVIPLTEATKAFAKELLEATGRGQSVAFDNMTPEASTQLASRIMQEFMLNPESGKLANGEAHRGFLTNINGRTTWYPAALAAENSKSVESALSNAEGLDEEAWSNESHPLYNSIDVDEAEIRQNRPGWIASVDDHMSKVVGNKSILGTALLEADSEGAEAKIAANVAQLFGTESGYKSKAFLEGQDVYKHIRVGTQNLALQGDFTDGKSAQVYNGIWEQRKFAREAITNNPQYQGFNYGDYTDIDEHNDAGNFRRNLELRKQRYELRKQTRQNQNDAQGNPLWGPDQEAEYKQAIEHIDRMLTTKAPQQAKAEETPTEAAPKAKASSKSKEKAPPAEKPKKGKAKPVIDLSDALEDSEDTAEAQPEAQAETSEAPNESKAKKDKKAKQKAEAVELSDRIAEAETKASEAKAKPAKEKPTKTGNKKTPPKSAATKTGHDFDKHVHAARTFFSSFSEAKGKKQQEHKPLQPTAKLASNTKLTNHLDNLWHGTPKQQKAAQKHLNAFVDKELGDLFDIEYEDHEKDLPNVLNAVALTALGWAAAEAINSTEDLQKVINDAVDALDGQDGLTLAGTKKQKQQQRGFLVHTIGAMLVDQGYLDMPLTDEEVEAANEEDE